MFSSKAFYLISLDNGSGVTLATIHIGWNSLSPVVTADLFAVLWHQLLSLISKIRFDGFLHFIRQPSLFLRKLRSSIALSILHCCFIIRNFILEFIQIPPLPILFLKINLLSAIFCIEDPILILKPYEMKASKDDTVEDKTCQVQCVHLQ